MKSKWMKIITPRKDYDIFISEKERKRLIKKYPWMWIIGGEE